MVEVLYILHGENVCDIHPVTCDMFMMVHMTCVIYMLYIRCVWCICDDACDIHVTLCNPMDYSLPGSSVHGILQARILEWLAIPFSRGSSQSRDWSQVFGIAGRFFIVWATWEAKDIYDISITYICVCVCVYISVQFTQFCPNFCDPMNHSMPGLPVHHQFPEFTQTHVHWVSDAIQPSHPLSSPSPPIFNLSQHPGLFKWVSSSHQVTFIGVSASASVLPMNTQDWSALRWTDWISLQPKNSQESSPTPTVQKHQFFGTQLSL